jgi:hypothetical protein
VQKAIRKPRATQQIESTIAAVIRISRRVIVPPSFPHNVTRGSWVVKIFFLSLGRSLLLGILAIPAGDAVGAFVLGFPLARRTVAGRVALVVGTLIGVPVAAGAAESITLSNHSSLSSFFLSNCGSRR